MRKYLKTLYFILGWSFLAIFIIVSSGITNWRQGLDLAGGVKLLYLMDFSQYKKNFTNPQEFNQQKRNVVNIVKKNIDNRISKLGVSDYNARYLVLGGKSYLEVELGGVDDIEKAKEIIGKTVQMTFKVPFEGQVIPEIKAQRQLLAEKLLEYTAKNDPKLKDFIENPMAWNVYAQEVELSSGDLQKIFKEDITANLTPGYTYPKLLTGTIQTINPITNKPEILNSYDIYKFIKQENGKYKFLKISVAEKPLWVDAKYNGKLLNGERFKMATVDTNQGGEIGVNIYFDETGKDMFCSLTKKYLGKPMAIFIGNKLITSPVIRAEICGGVANITGQYTIESASKLKDDLNTGAMPVRLKLEQEEKVSPTLGQKAFKNALIAAGVGLILIFILFWIFYGIRYAIITMISLFIFFVSLGAFIKLFGVVLSLSAIGAILLNIGMAVDANVIIFERVREELQSGSSFITAVQKGYEHSISAIRDGNLTTGLIALLLFMIGTNIFKGFGTMMIINILIVLFIMVPAIPGLLYLLGNKENK